MRILFGLTLAVIVAGCRDVVPVDNNSTTTAGYQVQGIVVDSTGHGIPGVAVRVAYTYVFYDSVSPGPLIVNVPGTGYVLIRIFDNYNNVVQQLYDALHVPGIMNVPWNFRDSLGVAVGSGVYYYSFSFDGTELLWYPILVDSAVTARTDSDGNFTINDLNFPVGSIVPRFTSDGTFLGNFTIYDQVDLLFSLGRRSAVQLIAITPDRVTNVKQVL